MKVSYYTKLSGTSFRQEEVAKIVPRHTPLRCVARPDNEYDPYAVEVQALLDEWTQVGWIQKGKNQEIQKELLEGRQVFIACTDITGVDKETMGVNVEIQYGEDDSGSVVESLPREIVVIGDEPFVYFDGENHKAYDKDGKKLYSGSKIEKFSFPEFDPTYPAKAMAKKTGLKADDIKNMWEWNGDVSSEYGTLIHKALEHYWLYNEQMMALDDSKKREHSAKNWMPDDLGEIVDKFMRAFVLDYDWEEVMPEVRVKYKQYTGVVDLYVRTKEGFYINDYKVVNELKEVKYPCLEEKKLKYTLQQNTYRHIIEKTIGEPCLGMYLWQWNGKEWKSHLLDRIDDKIFEEELWKKK